jgi:hypothetical protein
MLEMEAIVLQQHEEAIVPLHPPVMLHCLPAEQPPQLHEVIIHPKAGGRKASHHCIKTMVESLSVEHGGRRWEVMREKANEQSISTHCNIPHFTHSHDI